MKRRRPDDADDEAERLAKRWAGMRPLESAAVDALATATPLRWRFASSIDYHPMAIVAGTPWTWARDAIFGVYSPASRTTVGSARPQGGKAGHRQFYTDQNNYAVTACYEDDPLRQTLSGDHRLEGGRNLVVRVTQKADRMPPPRAERRPPRPVAAVPVKTPSVKNGIWSLTRRFPRRWLDALTADEYRSLTQSERDGFFYNQCRLPRASYLDLSPSQRMGYVRGGGRLSRDDYAALTDADRKQYVAFGGRAYGDGRASKKQTRGDGSHTVTADGWRAMPAHERHRFIRRGGALSLAACVELSDAERETYYIEFDGALADGQLSLTAYVELSDAEREVYLWLGGTLSRETFKCLSEDDRFFYYTRGGQAPSDDAASVVFVDTRPCRTKSMHHTGATVAAGGGHGDGGRRERPGRA
jgi:hypothetical protein